MERTKYDDLLVLAKQGNEEAQYEVGVDIITGKAVFTDASSQRRFLYDPNYGLQLLQQAAAKNHAEACAQLGFMYSTGDLVKADWQKYFQYTLKAAQLGSSLGANNLGWIFYIGDHVPQDLDAAFYWTKKSGDAGCAYAMETLAMMYWNGEGTVPHFEQAMHWLNAGADRGNAGMIKVREQLRAGGVKNIVGKIVLQNGSVVWTGAQTAAAGRQNLGMVLASITGKKLPISGGYGTSMEDAIILKCRSEGEGVSLEHFILSILFQSRNPEILYQTLQGDDDGRMFDVLCIKNKDKQQEVFFDISAFYGKSGFPF